jgi:hypothetical protein
MFLVLTACLFAAAAYCLTPHQTIQLGTDLIPLSDAHNPAHTPLLNPDAQSRVEGVINSWTRYGPPNDKQKTRCVEMLLSGVPVRWLVWNFTKFSTFGVPRGELSWFDKNGWQDSYPNKSGDTLTDTPTDLRSDPNVAMQEVNCSDFPTLPPLTPAQ